MVILIYYFYLHITGVQEKKTVFFWLLYFISNYNWVCFSGLVWEVLGFGKRFMFMGSSFWASLLDSLFLGNTFLSQSEHCQVIFMYWIAFSQ